MNEDATANFLVGATMIMATSVSESSVASSAVTLSKTLSYSVTENSTCSDSVTGVVIPAGMPLLPTSDEDAFL